MTRATRRDVPGGGRGGPPAPAAAGAGGAPSVYDDAELYDRVLGGLDFDLPYWVEAARRAGGPVLEVGCGTGRVLLPLLESGVDADGMDLSAAMLERARAKAAERGFRPNLVVADMADFTMPRRYALAICAFNGFAHADGAEAQIATLRCVREHLESGGALALHLSLPAPRYWLEPDGAPVLELEVTVPETGHTLQMWDTRFKDPVAQRQRSENEVREVAPDGTVVSSRRLATSQRWVYPREMELLFRIAGYHRWELLGGFDGGPLERPDQDMVAWAWRA